HALGDGSGRPADRLSVGVLSSRVLPMKPLLAGFFMMGLAMAAKDSCLECHSILEGALQAPAKAYSADIHSRHGFRCNDCHGGDPTSDDLAVSMNPARGFV